ncbi:hypothetical protein ARMGADRAFT_541071 [Armillaria gallica]|uniref:Uncharacterized protein n=1 Tax=Armillaria gallica TaxID=47427 RepID=A0A2H3D674_ARMGA|nr:hypothetical protein ARMGADRAFT_541071 [Armillaria gallica]
MESFSSTSETSLCLYVEVHPVLRCQDKDTLLLDPRLTNPNEKDLKKKERLVSGSHTIYGCSGLSSHGIYCYGIPFITLQPSFPSNDTTTIYAKFIPISRHYDAYDVNSF